MLTYRDQGMLAYNKLDEVIADMQRYEAELPEDQAIRRKFYYDYSYALNARQASKQTIGDITESEYPYFRDACLCPSCRGRQLSAITPAAASRNLLSKLIVGKKLSKL